MGSSLQSLSQTQSRTITLFLFFEGGGLKTDKNTYYILVSIYIMYIYCMAYMYIKLYILIY